MAGHRVVLCARLAWKYGLERFRSRKLKVSIGVTFKMLILGAAAVAFEPFNGLDLASKLSRGWAGKAVGISSQDESEGSAIRPSIHNLGLDQVDGRSAG